MGTLQGPRCPSCGHLWTGGSTLTCEACGAALRHAAGHGSGAAPSGHGRRPKTWAGGARRWWLVAGVAVALVTLAVVGTTLVGEEEVPDAGAPRGETPGPAAPIDVFAEVTRAGEAVCEPRGCERWRFELPGDGVTRLGEGFLAHTTTVRPVDAPPTAGSEEAPAEVEGSEQAPTELEGAEEAPTELEGAQEAPAEAAEPGFTTVTVVDLAEGELRWQRDLALRSDGSVPAVQPFGDLLLVPGVDGIAAYAASDGEQRWATGFGTGPIGVHEEDGDLVLLAARPGDDGDAPPGEVDDPDAGTSSTLARVRADTGEVRWRIDGVSRPVFTAGVAVATDADGLLVAIDLTDGTTRWEHGAAATPDRTVILAGDRVVVASTQGVEVLSLETGEVVSAADRSPTGSAPGPLRAVGSLLYVDPRFGPERTGPGAGPAPMDLYDLHDLGAGPRRVDDVVSALPLRDRQAVAATADGSSASGLAILSLTGRTYQLEVLDLDGEVRWERRWDAEGQRCCWTLAVGDRPGTLVVAPAELEYEPVRVLGSDDGEVLREVELRVDTSRVDHTTWHGPLALMQRSTGVQRTAVVGPGGWFVAGTEHAGVRIQTLSPVPLVQVGWEIVALDREVLRGRS